MDEYRLLTSALQDELTCALCQELYDKPQALIPCLHTLCLDCISCIPKLNDEDDNFNCPICRRTVNNFVNNFSIQNVISILKDTTSTIKREETLSAIETKEKKQVNVANALVTLQDYDLTEESSSSSTPNYTIQFISNTKKACRSCLQNNNITGFTCPIPITDEQQDGFGHILCGYCGEYMPARGFGGNEPALDQCCNFCGVVACDSYWTCKNRSTAAKLYILDEINGISAWLEDIDSIEIKEEGHLNKAEIQLLKEYLNENSISWREAWDVCLHYLDESIYTSPIVRRMTPLGLQVYNTRRLPTSEDSTDTSDDAEDYYDRIEQEGIIPSHHLRACYTCLVTIVNGQFYGYWKHTLRAGLADSTREVCPNGTKCETQWRTDTHAQRLSHIEI
ncbi:MAG: hypothetical protein EXX96DRAFT_538882 [Benjaminiella poitrasii]|nr:MAG: hypothetical protein EXX96DRAFT_538882 [Benjaminiella poitrasii]